MRPTMAQGDGIGLSHWDKLVLALSGGFMVLSFTYLYRRPLPENVADIPWAAHLHTASMWQSLPFIALAIYISARPASTATVWLNRITGRKVVYPLGCALLVMCAVVTLAGVRGIWWTWFSLGLMIAAALTVVALTNRRLMPIVSIILAVGLVALWRGAWELPYQFGLKLTYDTQFPQITGWVLSRMLAHEVAKELPLVVGGAAIMWYYRGVISCNRWFALLLALYVVLTATWFATGFWLDVYYDWDKLSWVHTVEFDKMSMFIYKFSKAALLLSFVTLLLPRRVRA